VKTNVQRFLDSIETPNTLKVANHVLRNVDDINIESYSLMELEQFILNMNPNSPRAIITICYMLSLYAKWLEDDYLYRTIQSLDKKLLWKKAKPNARKRFISHEEFKQVIHDIAMYEEFNALYYELLFRCVYEGVYSDDMSVVKNLRKSEIGDDIVELHEDNGHSYKLKISSQLAADLKKLADIDIWERKNRYGICKVDMDGVYNDSVFKTEVRKTSSEGAYRHSYYARLRKVSKEYLERGLLPLHLYISGIMHRIKIELNKNGFTLEEAFSENNRDKMPYLIISKELMRCNYEGSVGNFREIVKGDLNSF
jgi:hypothetical protein